MRVRLNIVRRFFLAFVLVSVVPASVIGLLSYRIAAGGMERESERLIRAALEAQRYLLEMRLGQAESLLRNLSDAEAITDAVAAGAAGDTYTRLATQARIGYILNGYLSMQGLVSISVWSADGAHFQVGDTLDTRDTHHERLREAFEHATRADHGVQWLGLVPNFNPGSRHGWVLAAAKAINVTERGTLTRTPRGIVLLSFDPRAFAEPLQRARQSGESELLLLDAEARRLVDSGPGIGRELSAAQLRQAAGVERSLARLLDARGQEILVGASAGAHNGWQVLAVTPRAVVVERARGIAMATGAALAAALALATLLAALLGGRFVVPLRQISDRFRRLRLGAPTAELRLRERARGDEIDDIVRGFNAHLDSLAAQQAANRALRESEERYALAARATNEGLWEWDPASGAAYFSPRFAQMLGLRAEQLGGDLEHWRLRVHPDDRGAFEQALAHHLDGQAALFMVEHRVQDGQGQYLWLLARGLAVRDAQGAPVRMAGSVTDVTLRRHAQERLRFDATHDALTGLHNRKWLLERLTEALERQRAEPGCAHALLFIDLDRFKLINDTQGHNVGDEVLLSVAQRLGQCIRAGDTLVRLGGDEFAVLMPLREPTDAEAVAARVLQRLAQPIRAHGHDFALSASIGIAQVQADNASAQDVLRDADIAMYRAKTGGRDRAEVFDAGMREQRVRRAMLEADLREAIEAGRLEVHYQPVVALGDDAATGFEALVRWTHPQLGPLSPADFVPLAEETRLIDRLGQSVLRAACRQLAAWQAMHPGLRCTVSVNLSPMQIREEDLVERLARIVRAEGVECGSIALELTESAIIHDHALAAHVIARARQLGFKVYLDDFGTGYSSLSHLAQFEIDAIKVDRSFLRGIEHDARKMSLVRALATLARELDMRIIGEGVETRAHLDLLRSLGFDACQGYHFARPLPAAQATRWLQGARQPVLQDAMPV